MGFVCGVFCFVVFLFVVVECGFFCLFFVLFWGFFGGGVVGVGFFVCSCNDMII